MICFIKENYIWFPYYSLTCITCSLSKRAILSFLISNTPFELIRSDVWGPSLIISRLGNRYFVMFFDDYTKYTWICFLCKKSEVILIIKYLEQWLLLNSLPTIKFWDLIQLEYTMNKSLRISSHCMKLYFKVHAQETTTKWSLRKKKQAYSEYSQNFAGGFTCTFVMLHRAASTAVYLINMAAFSKIAEYICLWRTIPLSSNYSVLLFFGCICFFRMNALNFQPNERAVSLLVIGWYRKDTCAMITSCVMFLFLEM